MFNEAQETRTERKPTTPTTKTGRDVVACSSTVAFLRFLQLCCKATPGWLLCPVGHDNKPATHQQPSATPTSATLHSERPAAAQLGGSASASNSAEGFTSTRRRGGSSVCTSTAPEQRRNSAGVAGSALAGFGSPRRLPLHLPSRWRYVHPQLKAENTQLTDLVLDQL